MDAPTTTLDLTNMTRKQRYYYTHKDDPVWKQALSQSKKEYYQRNREVIKEKNLKRYYERKAIQPPAQIET